MPEQNYIDTCEGFLSKTWQNDGKILESMLEIELQSQICTPWMKLYENIYWLFLVSSFPNCSKNKILNFSLISKFIWMK